MKIVIVEDDFLMRENLKLLLSGGTDISVIGTFQTAEEALTFLNQLTPDMLLVDLGLPGMSGIDFIKKAKEMSADIEIMVHTIYEDRENLFAALKAGASGYIVKGSTPRELIEGIYNLHAGGAPMSPRIARKVITEFQEENLKEQYLLTPREREILKDREKGLSYKEIAGKQNISPHTVHTHIKKIYEKLHARDREEALLKARKKGII